MRYRKKAAAVASLPDDILANIHGRLSLLDRLAFAAVFPASRAAFKPETPCLVVPGDAPDTATLFSLAEPHAAAVPAPGPQHVILGSSCHGWLVTADNRARMHLINPVNGKRRMLPAIDTIPCLNTNCGRGYSTFKLMCFLRGPLSYPNIAVTLTAEEMRHFLYRKVVLSDSADVAMLVTERHYSTAAFAMAGGGVWRLAPPRDDIEPIATAEAGSRRLRHSRNGIEDAVHHEGRFYSITYFGEVEVWEERNADDPGVFVSAVAAPRLLLPADMDHRKYLVPAPGGRLMVVLQETTGCQTSPSFKVQVLDAGRKEWKETDDIGNAALFVGVNGSLYVSTREHPELKAGCIYYYTEDDLGPYKDARDDENAVGVFSLKDGSLEKVEGLGRHRSWPPPAWFIPSIPW